MRLRAATRGSPLALWQVEPVVVETSGDIVLDRPIWEIGGKGVFVKEVQAAVLDGRADFAVHSAKDLPSVEVPGLVLACVPERGEPRDALVGSTLADLPTGALVATGSVRRRSQLAWLRPDLTFTGLRGNIATRLAKAPDFGAIVMAAAALERLGLADRAAEVLEPDVMLPQVGQGALAIECRANDAAMRASAGAAAHIPIARVTNLARTLQALHDEQGYWPCAVTHDATADAWSTDLASLPLVLVLGAEGAGLRPLVRRACKLAVRLPITSRVGSLNVSVAAGVALAEVARQRSARSALSAAASNPTAD